MCNSSFHNHLHRPGGYGGEQLIIDCPPDLGLVPLTGDVQDPGHTLQAGLLVISQRPTRPIRVNKIGVGLALCNVEWLLSIQIENNAYLDS